MEAVDAVTPLVADDPDVEVWHALLVRALHDAGRPRDATEAYLAARRHLRDELGVDPGEELREVYRRLLADRARTHHAGTARTAHAHRRARRAARTDRREPGRGRPGRPDRRGRGRGGHRQVLAARGCPARGRQQTRRRWRGAWDESRTPMAAWFEALGRPPSGPAGAPVPWVRERSPQLAVDGPVLVALDDAHHADSASLAALAASRTTGCRPASSSWSPRACPTS